MIYNIVGLGAVPNSTLDTSPAINSAFGFARDVFIPAGTFICETPIVMPAGARLFGAGAATVMIFKGGSALTNRGLVEANDDCIVEDLTLDGGNALTPKTEFQSFCLLIAGKRNTVVRDCHFQNWRRRAVYLDGATSCTVERCDFSNGGGASTTMTLFNCDNVSVLGNDLTGNTSNFGVYLDGTTRNCLIANNYANNATQLAGGVRSLEPIGVTRNCRRIRIIGNHCEGSGDNGISITGQECVVQGNVCIGNYHHGICLYGERNVCVGNVVGRNSLRFAVDGTAFHNITIQPAFGGTGRRNTVTGNTCFDNGAGVGTAGYGVRISGNAHPAWSAGWTLPAGNPYCFHGLNVYRAVSGTVTGSTPPTHTTGTASDGGVTWEFLYNDPTTLHPTRCRIVGNVLFGNRINDTVSEQVATDNVISAS